MKKWILTAALAALGVALLGQAVAFAATSPNASSTSATPAVTAPAASTDYLQAMFDLREKQMTDMQAWLDKYGDNPYGDTAQKALLDLHDKYFAARSKLLEENGYTLGTGHGLGYGPGFGRGMMGVGAGFASPGV